MGFLRPNPPDKPRRAKSIRRDRLDHVVAILMLAIAMIVTSYLAAEDDYGFWRRSRIDANEWTRFGIDGHIGWIRGRETSGRFPYMIFEDARSSWGHLILSNEYLYQNDPTYMRIALIVLPLWPMVLIVWLLTLWSIKRAGVIMPRWEGPWSKRRGFEPIFPADRSASEQAGAATAPAPDERTGESASSSPLR